MTCLEHDDRWVATLFSALTDKHDVREVWLALATARRRLRDPQGAADALVCALRRHVVDPGFAALADAIVRDAGAPGWCGLSAGGEPVVCPMLGAVSVSRRHGTKLAVTLLDGRHFLGSLIEPDAILVTVGCVRIVDGGLVG